MEADIVDLKTSFNAVKIKVHFVGKILQLEAWFEFPFQAAVFKAHILENKACREDQVYCFTYNNLHAVFFQA